MTQEALSSLQALGAQLRAKLLELPEYRALTVIERTIQELSEIINPPESAMTDSAEAPAVGAVAAHDLAGAAQRVEPPAPLAGSTQSRMARAIAETIAAKSSLNGSAPPGQTFSAAS